MVRKIEMKMTSICDGYLEHVLVLLPDSTSKHALVSPTENKPKREIIQTLVRRGYDSDPVKAWKDAQKKDKVCHFLYRMSA